jgi:8-oxo-dGTP pyrophosphatase MutT (NUDIX family)
VAWLGVRAAGVHLNGFVRGAQGLALWVARRARDKRTFPGHLDNLVAGGQPSDLDAVSTLRKECLEEAGLPVELAAQARSVGALHYVQQDGASLKPDTLTLFDLELPADFVPRPVDGEVESFALWPVERVLQSLVEDQPWKPNCALVVIDFLLRHGGLDAAVPAPARWRLWNALHGQVA